jgi:hypothetical protein
VFVAIQRKCLIATARTNIFDEGRSSIKTSVTAFFKEVISPSMDTKRAAQFDSGCPSFSFQKRGLNPPSLDGIQIVFCFPFMM